MDRKTSSSGGAHKSSDLRIVLLGYEESGKSSTGNTILGSDEFNLKKHAECVKKEGMVAGRQISVIDTPGRHKDYATQDTPKLYQQEVLRSVTLCPPGPHALLLVVNTQIQFMEEIKEAVVEHLKLFGETVWKHIIVLFTHVDQLKNTSRIEQHIELEGEPLRTLLEKCGNRYHVFNNKANCDSTQVKELLKKIDEMDRKNHGSHFELNKQTLSLVLLNKRVSERSIKRSQQEKHSEELRIRMGDEHKLKELRIVLLGRESAGKTSTADTILNSRPESEVKTTLMSTSREATAGRWQLTVIDTPGWLLNDPQSRTAKTVRLEIVRSMSLCPPGPHAFLLVIPANKTFTEANETAINDHLELLGEKVWTHTVVVFICADWMGDSPIELYIESEGKSLNRILKKCGNRYHVLCNVCEHGRGQVETLLEKIEMMVSGKSNSFYKMDEKSPREKADKGYEDETEDAADVIFQLPSDPKEGKRKRKHTSISTFDASSGYGTASLSECGSTDSAQGKRPPF